MQVMQLTYFKPHRQDKNLDRSFFWKGVILKVLPTTHTYYKHDCSDTGKIIFLICIKERERERERARERERERERDDISLLVRISGSLISE